MRGKLSFLYEGIWFDVTKCRFIVKNSSFKMLVVFSQIFLADTKITFVYNFVALLRKAIMERSNLGNIYFKKTPESLKKYKKQENYCSRLYKKERKKFFSNLDSSKICDNETFWKTIIYKKTDEWYNEWQRVVQRVTTKDNEW